MVDSGMVADSIDLSALIADSCGLGIISNRNSQTECNPRVTNVISIIKSQSLIAWQIRNGAENSAQIANSAAEFGTRLHRYIELHMKSAPFIDPSDNRALRRLNVFREWYAANVKSCIHSELPLQYRGAYCLSYRGTCDGVIELLNGNVALIDVKTSRSVHDSHKMQLGAYALACAGMGIHVDTCAILHLTDDCVIVHDVDISLPLRAFVQIRGAYGALYDMGLIDANGNLLT